MSPAAVGVARVAVHDGVVLGELRSDVALRARLCLAAGEGRLDDVEWQQVATILADETRRRAASLPRDAGECRRCGQPVRWVRSSSGKAMPLDPLPHPRGNVVVKPQGRAMLAFVHPTSALPLTGQTAYRVHAATCPRAAKPRRTSKDAGPICAVCKLPMDRVMWDAGDRTHPCCTEATR